MINSNCKSLLSVATFLLCFSAMSLAQNVGIHLRVTGYDDVGYTSTILVTDGNDAYTGTVVNSHHDTEYGDPPETDWAWNEELEQWDPIAWGPIPEYWVNQWTEYRAALPPQWVGRGVSFSNDGTGWTSFKLFDGNDAEQNEQRIEIDQNEWGQRPVPDPDAWVTTGGNRLRLGHWWSNPSQSVFSITSWDNDNPYWPCIGMDIRASTANAYWRWYHPSDDGEGTTQVMGLDFRHRLSLVGRDNPSASIVLDPDQSRVLVNGLPLLTKESAAPNFVARNGNKAVIGTGLVAPGSASATAPGQLVLGRYNVGGSNDGVDHTRGVLIVGTGSGGLPSQRSTAIRITEDGRILLRKAGDIEMGAFQAGEQP